MSQNDMPQPPKLPLDYEVSCEIALTPEQQRIVKEQTGRDMTEIVLEDEDGQIAKTMQDADPDDFTVIAIRQAERLNQYDEDYHAYLEELAAWQDEQNAPDPMDEVNEAASVAAAQIAEKLRLFFEKETQACENAREFARLEWKNKDVPAS